MKIADFGLAKVFQQDEDAIMRTFYVGTRGYQAPEILKKKHYTVACDIFSCGVVLFILLAGYPPFEAATPKCRWYAPLATGNAREFWKQHRGCGIPGPAKDLITRMLWYDWNKRISIRGIKKHKWFNGVTLSPKHLAQELRDLHRLMEIKRRDDADKQSQLQDSIKRGCLNIGETVKIYDGTADDHTPDLQMQTYYADSVIENVAEILKATLVSGNLGLEMDCTSDVISRFWDENEQRIVCQRLVSRLTEALIDDQTVQMIAKESDAYLMINFSDEQCYPPQLPDNETVTLKDVFTTCAPRYVLSFIEKVVLELGGNVNVDFNSVSLEAHLATHNFPAPVTIQVRIFMHAEYNCYLVKFERVSGNALHFGRVLHQLIKDCWPALTGLPDEHFGQVTDEEFKEVEIKFGACRF